MALCLILEIYFPNDDKVIIHEKKRRKKKTTKISVINIVYLGIRYVQILSIMLSMQLNLKLNICSSLATTNIERKVE